MNIDCVIAGKNCAKTLAESIRSVLAANHDGKTHVYYVDMGSTDGSLETASAMLGITVTSLGGRTPSLSRAYNAGWRMGGSELVQFMEADCLLSEPWFKRASKTMAKRISGAYGRLDDLKSAASGMNLIRAVDMDCPPRPKGIFNHVVLLKRKVLEKTGGWDESMLECADLEYSLRLMRAGRKVAFLKTSMAGINGQVDSWADHVIRCYRQGYGLAQAMGRTHAPWLTRQVSEVLLRGGFLITLALVSWLGMLGGISIFASLFPLSIALIIAPRAMYVGRYQEQLQISEKAARLYSWHKSLAPIPKMLGMLRFLTAKITRVPMADTPGWLQLILEYTDNMLKKAEAHFLPDRWKE